MNQRPGQPRLTRSTPDPYGLRSVGSYGGPIAAAVGLAVAAWLTFGFLTGDFLVPGAISGNNGGGGPVRTPTPSGQIVIPQKDEPVPGSIVYAKGGNLWIQSGTTARQLTTTGRDSMASWSPDGQWIYYVETVEQIGLFHSGGRPARYDMAVPNLMRIRADGSAKAERIATGKYRQGTYTWFYWLRQPVLSPNGRTIALVSDGPDALRSDVVLQFYDLKTGKLTNPKLGETSPLGHQDPAWRPDGKLLLYVRNGRDGARGTPVIYRYDPATKKATPLTGPGYTTPAWSRDGKYIAATRTDSFGTDIVILDARRGTELARLTNDGQSWAPVWSPKGDSIAFLHLQDGIVDLRLIKLEGSAPNWTVGKTEDLTESAGLDGQSHPGWFIPADQLPALPSTTTAPSAGGSGAASSAP